jgi:hypothetical protein
MSGILGVRDMLLRNCISLVSLGCALRDVLNLLTLFLIEYITG